jgi:hypothetical protein
LNHETPFDQELSQTYKHVSNPVQTILFANLAPNYDIIPSKLISECLDRSSFDINDKVMEMTP